VCWARLGDLSWDRTIDAATRKEHSMTQRIVMLLPKAEPALSQAAALAEHDRLSVAFIDPSAAVSPDTLARFTLLLVWVESVQPNGLPMILKAARSICTVLVVSRDTFLDAIGVIDYFDAVLFADQPLERQIAALDTAADGFVVLPSYIDGGFTSDSFRWNLVQALTARERSALAMLASGATNRAIAETMGVTEGTAKGLVRAVLKKLHFRNRTEAALFVARNPWAARGPSSAHPDFSDRKWETPDIPL